MNSSTILVIGKNGQLGRSFQAIAKVDQRYRWKFYSRNELDLTNSGFDTSLQKENFDILINCAAYTAVDKAESEKELCDQINSKAVASMAEVCRQKGALFIHFSSDYVYHNQLNRPLKEDDHTTPNGVYASSKLEGEKAVLAANIPGIIIRTSWVFSPYGKNFFHTMLHLASFKDKIQVVDDQIGSPTFAPDISEVVMKLLSNQSYVNTLIVEKKTDVINFSNEGVASWYDFAKAIFELKGMNIECNPISTSDYPTPAKRPSYSVLDKNKIRTLLGDFKIPHWKEALFKCFTQQSEVNAQ